MVYKEGDKVVAYIDALNAWVKGTFMFYFNDSRAYIQLDTLSIPVIAGTLYTNEPIVEIRKIKSI